MSTIPRIATALAAFIAAAAVAHSGTPDGFAVWSEGSAHNRTLHKLDLEKGRTPDPKRKQMVCAKGPHGGDIQANISLDGSWVAFSRSLPGTRNSCGGNDYHTFDKWDVYIVRVDGPLPAKPIRVDHGYWPSWGDDSTGSVKTLYYSVYEGKKIKKAIIGPDGQVRGTSDHVKVPTREGDLHMMCAPDGRKVAFRESGRVMILDITTGKKVVAGGGCHPEWCTDSWWLMHAQRGVNNVNGTKRQRSGLGIYHYGCSNDMRYVITRIGSGHGNDQNAGHPIWFFTLDCSREGDSEQHWNVSRQHKVSDHGTFPDIHVNTGPSVEIAAEPENAVTGGTSTITWSSRGAERVLLDGKSVAKSGSMTVRRADTYRVVGTDARGRRAAASVKVTFSAPHLTRILPATSRLIVGDRVELTAVDQTGAPMRATWRVASGGRLTSRSGTKTTFVAGDGPAEATVTATAATASARVVVKVIDPAALAIRINSGGPSSAADGWNAGATRVSGGGDFRFAHPPETRGVPGAAPAAVYQTCRHGDHRYRIPVDDGTYKVTLHFYDEYGGGRAMHYTIEGRKVLEGFAPPKGAAVVKTFDVEVSDGNGIEIDAKRGRGNDVFESGIEVAPVRPRRSVATRARLAPATARAASARPVAWPASRDGLALLWLNTSTPGAAFDERGRALTGFALKRKGQVWHGRHNEMTCYEGTFDGSDAAAYAAPSVTKSRSFTLELSLTFPKKSDRLSSTIFCFGRSSRDAQLAVLERRGSIVVRAGSAQTTLGRVKDLASPDRTMHLVVTSKTGRLKAYCGGAALDRAAARCPLPRWRPRPLVFGSDPDLSEPWHGTIRGVTLYARSLKREEVERHAAAAAARFAREHASPLETVTFRGRLLERSATPDPARLAPYKYALAVYHYRVDGVLRGTLAAKSVYVLHRTVCDGKKTDLANRRVGSIHTLTISSAESWPIEGEYTIESIDMDFDATLYYDTGMEP